MNIIKKSDVILITVLLLLAITFNFFLNAFLSKEGAIAVIKINGTIYDSIDINKNKTFEIKYNKAEGTIKIEDKTVKMIKSNCPDQYCVKHYPINKTNETIVCLPNKIVIEIISETQSEYDSIAY